MGEMFPESLVVADFVNKTCILVLATPYRQYSIRKKYFRTQQQICRSCKIFSGKIHLLYSRMSTKHSQASSQNNKGGLPPSVGVQVDFDVVKEMLRML